ncbi:helix-turn-helix transcriptional regulator [Streptomyces sp. LUP47B]|uniref:helix-turn-helix domain-containing protein n=1 Tax=Streptomyces sp. LUP47B TaxID=1890286 RepID=UPI0008520DBE|nr:helix-turn-helix transcriptional regulator [Streptomyces sp. LUP47B]
MSAPEPQDDVQEFAALLRRLKERTDRSYGSLARRLNMNTSTLHRYCAGDAVPVDFAPVERFAALCGASAEERMELHRLWLSAVAARQRPRAGETAGEPEQTDAADAAGAAAGTVAATATEAAVGGGSGAGAADGATATADLAPAADGGASATADEVKAATAVAGGAANGSVAGAAADGGAAVAVNPATDSHTVGGRAANVGDVSAARDCDAAGVGLGGDVSASAKGQGDALLAGRGAALSRPWYRRRRVVMTAAAAVALLATLGSLSALPSGRSASDEVAQAPDPSSATTTTASGTPGRSPSKSPSPSATSGSPSPVGTRNSLSPSAPGGGAVSKDTGRSEQQGTATGTPLTWTVNSQIWEGSCGHDYVIDKPPSQVPPPPLVQDAGIWAATQGAIHGRETKVQISVQGRSSTAVVLEALRVRIAGRGSPAPGTAYAMDQGCGGGITPRGFDVNLDIDRPVAHAVAGNDTGQTVPAVQFPYRVSATDPEVLLVTATTQTYDCNWYLELDWSSQGRTGTVRVDDHGRPFRTTSIKGLTRLWYGTNAAGERAWVDAGS